jgi:alkanesulfonate monooxygenase SsuD/methylene tetrahydromethanopterin reductase-like flavin-dependent oxidoreductase (luciferase family)
MSLLGLLRGVTRRIELGTCVVQLPIRHPVEHAHRVQSINLLSDGRLRFGIGTGSTRHDFDAVQADFDTHREAGGARAVVANIFTDFRE